MQWRWVCWGVHYGSRAQPVTPPATASVLVGLTRGRVMPALTLDRLVQPTLASILYGDVQRFEPNGFHHKIIFRNAIDPAINFDVM